MSWPNKLPNKLPNKQSKKLVGACEAIHINFARRSLQNTLARTALWQLALLLTGLALLLYAFMAASTISTRSAQLDEQLLRITRQSDKARIPKLSQSLIPQNQALAINAIIQQLNLPWSDVFDAVEAATPSNIALIAIEPDARKHSFRGEAESLNSDDMIAYIEKLKKQPLFLNVNLIRHEVNEQDPYKPLRFQFEAQWKVATP